MEHLAALDPSQVDEEEKAKLESEISNLKEKIFCKLRDMKSNEKFLTNYYNNEMKQDPDISINSRFRIQKTFTGHGGRIQDIAWSKDGSRLVSAAQDGKLLTWNTDTTNKRNLVTLKSASVLSCSYSSNNTHIASGGFDTNVYVFNTDIDDSFSNENATHRTTTSNQQLITHSENSINNSNDTSNDNNNSNNNNGHNSNNKNNNESNEWEIQVPSLTLSKHEGYVSGVEFLANENAKILSCSGDSTINLWDITVGKPISKYKGHRGDVMALKQNPTNSNLFVTVDIEAQSKLWDIRMATNEIENESNDNNYENSNNNNNNNDNNACVATLTNREKDNNIDSADIQDVSWFPDGNSFINGNDNGKIRLFDIRTYCQMNEYFVEKYNEKALEAVSQIDFTKGGRYIVAGYCGCEPYCLIWNALNGEIECEMYHSQRASCVSVAPNGYSIMTGCWDTKIRMWA